MAKLLLAHGADVNARGNDCKTPLHYAAWHNALKMAKLLLNHGADVNARGDDAMTPLHYAAVVDAHEMEAFLLSKGADGNAEDTFGDTPCALRKRTIEIERAIDEAIRAVRKEQKS